MLKLTTKQKKIILDRYENKLGLNTSAMHRDHPEIIARTFEFEEGEQPIGWRKTLLSLKIDPFKIEHDIPETINCLVCGKPFRSLSKHLLFKHGYTTEDYREEYGERVELLSESLRANMFENKAMPGVPHWERLWTPYYILDYFLALQENGYRCNSGEISDEIPIVAPITRYFGSWDTALAKTGLTDARIGEPRESWTQQKVIEALREVAKKRENDSSIVISESLHFAIRRKFSSAEHAYKASGVTKNQVLAVIRHSDEEYDHIINLIRAVSELKGVERRDRMQEISAKYNHITYCRYSSLRELCIQNNIPVDTVATKIYRHKEDVIHDLNIIKQRGERLTLSNIRKFNYFLCEIVKQKGWGKEKVEKAIKFPEYDLTSGSIKDKLIHWRVQSSIDRVTAASLLNVTYDRYYRLETKFEPNAQELTLIKEQFAQSNIDWSK